jgi:hypothetical protein
MARSALDPSTLIRRVHDVVVVVSLAFPVLAGWLVATFYSE